MKTRGSFALLDSLVRNGTRHIFGYPGGAILPIYDDKPDHQKQGVATPRALTSVSFGCRCRRCAPAASRADADQRVSVNLAASGGRAGDRTDA